MLKVNLKPVLAARGVTKLLPFLVDAGFSYRSAHILITRDIALIKLVHLEKLCKALYCTPNDLLEWQQDKNAVLQSSHPLQSLNPERTAFSLYETMKTLPLDKLQEVNSFLQNGKDPG